MRKIYVFGLAAALFFVSCSRQSSERYNGPAEEIINEVTESESSYIPESEEDKGEDELSSAETANEVLAVDSWQDAYADFLRNQINYEEGYFSLWDLDDDGIPELIISNNAALTAYSYNGEVCRIDEYVFYTGTVQHYVSYNSAFSGIFQFSVGGGRDWYGYLSLQDNKLVYEQLWSEAYAFEDTEENRELYGGIYQEFSRDKELIEESRNAFIPENYLKFCEASEENIQRFIFESDMTDEPVSQVVDEDMVTEFDENMSDETMSMIQGTNDRVMWIRENYPRKYEDFYRDYDDGDILVYQSFDNGFEKEPLDEEGAATQKAIEDFGQDWEAVYGKKNITELS